MMSPRTAGLRSYLVVVLTFVLTLTGVGRGFAGTPSLADVRYAIPGVHVQICHSGASDQHAPDPALPVEHDCCEACALLAPALMPEPPVLSAPASAFYVAAHADALAWMPSTARPRSPRQSQGPPAT